MWGEEPLTDGVPAPVSREGGVNGGGRGSDSDGVGEADMTVDRGDEELNKGTLLWLNPNPKP
jgi:hypothetical protein